MSRKGCIEMNFIKANAALELEREKYRVSCTSFYFNFTFPEKNYLTPIGDVRNLNKNKLDKF